MPDMSLTTKRQSIRSLLSEQDPVDAPAVYYAYYHPDAKTHLVTHLAGVNRASGYLAISRTGMDLFSPLVSMRLPSNDMDAGRELITKALPEGSSVILYVPARYGPLLHALFDIQASEQYRLLVLDRNRFEPIINVLVTQATSPDGLPRFVIRSPQDPSQVVAAAGLNWQTPNFCEISVTTSPGQRRQGWGRSVVAAMVHHQLQNGRTPLYVVGEQNEASLRLAERVGFIDSGERLIFTHATRKNLT